MTSITLIKCSRCGHVGRELEYVRYQRPERRLCPSCSLAVKWLELGHARRVVDNIGQLAKYQRFETRVQTIIAH